MSREPSYVEGCGLFFCAAFALFIGVVFAQGIYEDYYGPPKPPPTVKEREEKAVYEEFVYRRLVIERLNKIERNQEEILKKLGGREVEREARVDGRGVPGVAEAPASAPRQALPERRVVR